MNGLLKQFVGLQRGLWVLAGIVALCGTMAGQSAVGDPQQAAQGQAQSQAVAGQATQSVNNADQLRPTYILGPGDQVVVRALQVDEIGERPYRVDGDGFLNLPLLGKVKASGITLAQLEADLTQLLRRYVQRPQVIVTVVQFRSEPVFFVGAFKTPGIYPLQGKRTLVEMLTSIGGLLPNASRRLKVTRRKDMGPIPLPNATDTADGKGTVVEISMGSLRENVNPAEDISLQPFDVISVERAELVYVNGEVSRVGSFELGERESMSIVQAITLAGGMTPNASPEEARVLRAVLSTSRRAEVPINIKKILAGKATDFQLLPNDLLYIPKRSDLKRNVGRGALIALPLIPTLLYLGLR